MADEREIMITVTVGLTIYIDEDDAYGEFDTPDQAFVDGAIKQIEDALCAARNFSSRKARLGRGSLSRLGYIIDDIEGKVED